MSMLDIRNKNNPLTHSLIVKKCDAFFCQLIGYMFRLKIKETEGLLFIQGSESRISSSIHMLFVFTELAIIWLDSDFRVVDILLAKPWRPFYFPRVPAIYILEIHRSRLNEFSLGDQLEIIRE